MDTGSISAASGEPCSVGAEAERAGLVLYSRLIATVTEADIAAVMAQQRAVSNDNHLPAFARLAS